MTFHPFAIVLVIVAALAGLFIIITVGGMTYAIVSGVRKLFDRSDRRRGFEVTPTAEASNRSKTSST